MVDKATLDLLAGLIADLDRAGVKELIPEGDRLRYRPKSALTPDLADRLRTHKADLLAVLRPAEALGEGEPGPGPFPGWVQAPDTRGRLGLQSPAAPVPFGAWEDLPVWSDSAPADPAASPCYGCGRRHWWRSIHGVVVCGHCHPPAVPGVCCVGTPDGTGGQPK